MLRYAVEALGLPETLKLSVHSGSDKFSLYSIISELVAKYGEPEPNTGEAWSGGPTKMIWLADDGARLTVRFSPKSTESERAARILQWLDAGALVGPLEESRRRFEEEVEIIQEVEELLAQCNKVNIVLNTLDGIL